MLESKQIVAYDDPSKTFVGVRFVLLGFESVKEEKVRLKLLEGGGVDAVNYSPDCNHVIVDKLVYDDPMCIGAQRDGKTLVTGLWVDHSFDVGMPVDPSSVMYRPMRDLNGIPGAKSLVVCLTGYQRQDRDDIMTMVALMGANFSKPLVANKVTHLICYKFEGEKYELAKKMKKIKLVNHRWLEDCLKTWELLPEADYSKSGYELEMMAEAKDSEEETEDMASTVVDLGRKNVISPQITRVENKSFCRSPGKEEISRNGLNFSASRNLANYGDAIKIQQTPGRETHDKHVKMSSPFSAKSPGKKYTEEPLNISENVVNVLASASERAKNSPDAEVSKLSGKSKVKSTPVKQTSPLRSERNQSVSGSPLASNVNKLGVSGGFEIGYGVKTPLKGTFSPHDEGQNAKSVDKSKTTISRGRSKSPVLSPDIDSVVKTPLKRTLSPPERGQNAKSDNRNKTTVSRGSSKSPILSPDIDSGVKTPLKEILSSRDEGQTVKSPNKSKTTVSRGNSKSPMLSHDPKMLMESELATKTAEVLASGSSIDRLSGFASDISSKTVTCRSRKEASSSKKALSLSGKGLKTQTLPNLDMEDLSSVQTKNSTGEVEIHQSDVQSIEPPFERTNSGIEKMDGQDDLNVSKDGRMGAQLKPLKRKMLAKKTLGSRPKISKGNTTKLKGSLNLHKAILQNEYEIRPNGAVAMENTETANVDDETKAPDDKGQNEFVRENNKSDINLEKDAYGKSTQVKGNSSKSERAVVSKKTELTESKSKVDAGEKKTAKGKKRPLANTKTKKSKISEEEVKKDEKQDENKTVSDNEETVVLAGKTKTRPSKKLKSLADDLEKENNTAAIRQKSTNEKLLKNGFKADRSSLDSAKGTHTLEVKDEPAWFILSGHRLQRKDFQQLIRRLKGRVCRDSHHWSYQATHFIVPDPVRRTEKFFAAAASGSWILKTDYLTASNEAGKLLSEEPYEWHKKCLTEDGAINLEAPRKWRLLKEKTGHGAFYGMRIVIYGECIAPPLDTLKRVIKAGDGTILATSPPYTRFLQSRIDFAIVSPGMPRVDMWVQEFLRHEVPCVVADYLVEYVCKPGYPLDRHVQYNTHAWAQKSLENLANLVEQSVEDVKTPQDLRVDDVACQECGSRDRGDEMLICGDESGGVGCGVGCHFDCLDPQLEGVPEEDWFCLECSLKRESKTNSKRSKKKPSKSKK